MTSNVAHQPFTYVDAEGVTIHAYRWDAEQTRGAESPLAVVQISHGIGEHARRYDAFARALAAQGYTVYADDHRGHGQTGSEQGGGDPARLGPLGKGGLKAAEAAILQLTELIREWHPGVPLVMFAHSWGSLMAQRLLNAHPRAWDALILSGSAFRTLRYMESGKLNAKWAADGATGFEWLSRDPAVWEAFGADPLCFDADTAKLLGIADTLKLVGKPGAGLASDVPILITAGSEDPLSRGDSLRLLAEAYRARGVRDVRLKIYQGARHEIINETNRDEVVQDLITWITDRVAGE